MKVDTLHLVLEHYFYTLNELINEIQRQKYNFIKKFGYEPKKINVYKGLYMFLLKQNKIKRFSENIYGMEIQQRSSEIVEVLSENESICIKEEI